MPYSSYGYMPQRVFRLMVGLVLTTWMLVAVVGASGEARAGDAVLTATDTTAPNIVGDSNVQSQPQQGPDSFTIAVEFCSTGASTPMDGVVAYIGDGTTPGEFPDTVVPPGGDYEGTFDLDMVTGLGNDAVRPIGTLDPGACRVEFWIVSYDVVDASGNPVWGASNDPLDDLVLGFDFWAVGTDRDSGARVEVKGSDTVTVRNEISANTNRIAPNKAVTTVDPGTSVAVGQVVSVTFEGVTFGRPNKGFDADGDGIPDEDLWFQPIGEASLWNPDYFRLIGVDATLEGTHCGGGRPDVTLHMEDTFYQSGLDSHGGCHWDGSYTYEFMALTPGSSTISPYQEVASGSDNEKYNGDYCGTDPASEPDICVVLSSTNTLSIDKQVNAATASPGDTLAYTVTVINSGSEPVGDPVTGFPLVVSDPIASGASFVAGSAACDSGCTPEYSTDGGASFSPVEPGDPATITAVRWMMTSALGAGSTASFSFEVVIDGGATGTVSNRAGLSLRDGQEFLWATADTTLPLIDVTKTPSVSSVPEPGGSVTFAVAVDNLTADQVMLTSLTDDVFGDLLDGTNGQVSANTCDDQGLTIAAGGSLNCTFDASLSGSAAGASHTNTVTAVAEDSGGTSSQVSDEATVGFSDVMPSISVTKMPLVNSIPEPGGTVTFSVEMTNTGVEAVTLTSLSDDVLGDLLDPANGAVSNNDCDDQPIAIGAGSSLTCRFDAALAGGFGDPGHTNTVTATAQDDEGNPVSGDDDATVEFTEAPPSVSVTKTPSVGQVPETGGMVTFTVQVTSTGPTAVTLTSLTDDVSGDLLDPANAAILNNDCDDQAPAIGVAGTFICSFDASLTGDAGGPDHVNTVTAMVEDGDGDPADGSDQATVAFDDVMPSLSISKTPSVGSVAEPGGTVTFEIEVTNISAEAVTLISLTDDVFGDLLDAANGAVSNNDCDDQTSAIAAGGTFLCSFEGFVAGDAGDPDHLNTVAATVEDNEGTGASATGDTTVAFGDVSPTISVSKMPSLGSVAEPGDAVIFSIAVTNTSPESVTLTSLADDVFGDLLDPANPVVGKSDCDDQLTAIEVGGTFACSFEGFVAGDAGDPEHLNTVIVGVVDDEGSPGTGSDSAAVSFADVMPSLSISKTPSAGSIPEPGGTVAFAIQVTNTSGEMLSISSLMDDVFGDLLDPANLSVGNNGCDDQPAAIEVGGMFSCSFEGFVAGVSGGPDHANTVTAEADDNEGKTATATADATVTFSDPPQPAAVLGSVWLDLDPGMSGRLDRSMSGRASERPLGGIVIDLLDDEGFLVATRTTVTAGGYSFDGLAPGDYTLVIDQSSVPAGYGLVLDPDGDSSGETGISLDAGQIVTDQDFVEAGMGSIGDLIWHDANADGLPDPDEAAMSGIAMRLTWVGFDGALGTGDDWEYGHRNTNGDGLYRFEHLPPGVFFASVDFETVGNGMSATTPVEYQIQLEAGQSFDAGDIGFTTDDEPLPQTGFNAEWMGPAAFLLLLVGIGLLLMASWVDQRRRIESLKSL